MSCGESGRKKTTYTGNQVGSLNAVGDMNYVAGGPAGSGLSAGTIVEQFIPSAGSRRVWLRDDAKLDDKLLDAAYPTIELQWFAEITLTPEAVFRVSDKAFYVQDADGNNRFYDARVDKAPSINVTVGEWLSSNYEVSDVRLTINNRDGYFNQWLPMGDDYRQWSGAKVIIKVGFGEKYENYLTIFEGQVSTKKGLTTTRDTIEVSAYDKLDLDEIPLPPRVFSQDNYPDMDSDDAGKPVPIVYGDWENDVPDSGSVNAYCINANDSEATACIFKVSDLELESLSAVYLHRSKRKEGEPAGPIQIDLAGCTVDLSSGQFAIPKGFDILLSEIPYSETETAGVGSSVNLITAQDTSVNFIAKKVQVGDRVLKRKTGEYATVSQVLNTQMTLTGGITFAEGDEFIVLTRKYNFIDGDKLTVKCKGKALNLMSTNRLSDVSTSITAPQGITIGFDQTYWLPDNATQTLYNLSFDNEILAAVPYGDIKVGLTSISSISIATDNKLWLVDPDNSMIYRYDHESGQVGLEISTTIITGIAGTLANITGIAVESTNRFWIYDQASGYFYQIDAFNVVSPYVVTSFNKNVFDVNATQILDIAIDQVNSQLVCVDRDTNKYYRISAANGALVSSSDLTVLGSNVSLVQGVAVAQDGTLFFVDQGTLSIYNYNEAADTSTNPAYIARDLLQKFGGHTYEEFDLSWNNTAKQLSTYKCRAVIQTKTNMITFINKLLTQYNTAFFLRFGKFGLFYITFDNFRTDGRLAKEKDIKEGTFKPGKEMNQYFNSAYAAYDYRPYTEKSKTSDTYVSPAAISFAGKEVSRKLDLPNVYRREDLDKLLPLYVRLAAPEPEFVDVTFGFRLIRTQMHDFLTVNFDGDINVKSGKKDSGRRFDSVPCMVRKISYDLGPMTVTMKLWSLGNTAFSGYVPKGSTIGGQDDDIVLSNIGRQGRISPIGTITGSGTNTITLEDVAGQTAEERDHSITGLAWAVGYSVDIVNGSTKLVEQTLTIQSVSGGTITFDQDLTVTVSVTTKNAAGFINGGHYLQYSVYPSLTETQRQYYASFAKPLSNYPTSRTQELEEQRGGTHNFDDGGQPYVLFPINYVQY